MAGLQSQSSWREVLPSPSVLKFESCFLVFPLAVLIMLYSHLVQNHLAQSHPSSLLEGICSTIITVYIFFYFVSLCVWAFCLCVCSCTTCVHLRGHERASYPLGLELQMVVSHVRMLGIETMLSGRAAIAPDQWFSVFLTL